MANLFINIPVPPANGSGAPVDVSAMGASKTISVTGLFVAFVTVEISNEIIPTKWAPLITFGNPDGIVLDVACRWMRVSVAGYKSGAPQCDVGSSDNGTTFASLPALAGDGPGPAVNTALLPLFKTVTVGGAFGGTVQIEVSQDGVGNWSQLGFGFPNAGQQSQVMAAQWMRVVRAGVPQIAPGLPVVDVGACSISGGGVGPPGPGVDPLLYTVFVGKNGNDGTADGSIGKPFLTVQAAMAFAYTTYVLPAEPQVASPFTRPCVFVAAGTYADGDLVLPPQICVMGEGFNHTRIEGNWTIDARWTNPPASDLRSTWLNVGIVGGVTIDFLAFGSTEGKVYAMGSRFFSPVAVIQANNQVNAFECKACDFFGDITITGCETTLSACTTYGGTITLNQSLLAGADNKFKSSGGSIGNIVVNSLAAANPYNCTFSHLVQPGATLTLNGQFSSIFAALGSVPLQSLVVLAGGANLNQVFRINQLDWSGVTADRPPGPYVGQQYFDTTLGTPVWWDGATWITFPTGASAPQIIVYAPAAIAPPPPVYNNWAAVEAAINAVDSACQLWVDQTGFGGYAPVPATASLDGKGRLEIIGKGGAGEAGLTFADGAQIKNVQTFRTIVLRGQSNTIPPLLWDLDGMVCELYDATFLFAGVCTQPVMQISVPSYISFIGGHSTELRNGGNPGAAVMNINAPALVFLALDTLFFPSPFVDTIAGAVGSTLDIQTDASFPPVITIPAFLGTLTQVCIDILVRNTMALPEQWAVDNVPANTPTTPMSAQVSTNFDTIKMMRPGHVVGLSTRLTEAITAGTVQAELTKNGVVVPAMAVLMGVGSTGGQQTRLPGVVTYVAGDLIGVNFVTSVGFTPITTDLEAWLEVVEDWNQ